MRTSGRQLRVGLIGLGLATYWEQFEGLKERLEGHLSEVERRVSAPSRITVNLGLVDTPQKGVEAGHECRREDIDILLVYITTYALSATVLPVILRAKVPVILLNLQPAPAIDYGRVNQMTSRTAMTGEWLAYCSSCPVPEIANVLNRLGLPFHQVTGVLYDDPGCWNQIEEWLRAAGVACQLAHSRLGLMGHYYSGMLDIATDLVQVSGRFGIHVEMLEMDAFSEMCSCVTITEIDAKLRAFEDFFEVTDGCSRDELIRAARTAVALDRLVAKDDLDLIAYYYKGMGIRANEDAISSIILGASLLTGRGIPVAGEYEIKNVIAMKIMDGLSAGGSFTEYYALDFESDLVLMGHDGPGHIAIAEGKIKVRPLQVYHGKVGSGLSVEMSVKQGPVTLLSVVEDKDTGFCLQVAEGESVVGANLEIGNTNSRYRFAIGARQFAEQWSARGPAHHCAIGLGHVANQIEKLASLMGLRFVRVC